MTHTKDELEDAVARIIVGMDGIYYYELIDDARYGVDGAGAKPIYRYFVTKLRCECGEEQDRYPLARY